MEQNRKIRYTYYKQMQQIIHDFAPVIPLFYAETLRFLSQLYFGV